jgi:uncharacterized protein YdeI (YjbR/CyaY-like superfamily)
MATIASGVVHAVPADLRAALRTFKTRVTAWNDLTPLARNEWICWTISVKKAETRREHIERLCYDITHGKRRPCCWPGCPHRERAQSAIAHKKR